MPREASSTPLSILGGSAVRVVASSHVSVGWHMHVFYELVFVREGFCLHHVEDSVFLAMEGDLLLIKPGTPHQYTGTRECKIYNCLFTAEAFEDVARRELMKLPGMAQILSEEAGPFPHMHLDMAERKSFHEILGHMARECLEQEPGWDLKVRALLCHLMVDCSRVYTVHGEQWPERDCYSGYVTRALRYIDEHYAEDSLTVQGLGEHVGVSGDYLSRQFRKMTGIAVQEYVRRYRLSRAITSLQQGCSVGEAARQNGFHSISYFSREFKKAMGVAPSQYESV